MQVTEGPNAGKLALLDFGLVAEVPQADRDAMVSATIHLGNRDWDALIDDFIALRFLPANSDRGLIIPIMDKVLSPYLRGGGAKAFNFQVGRLHLQKFLLMRRMGARSSGETLPLFGSLASVMILNRHAQHPSVNDMAGFSG